MCLSLQVWCQAFAEGPVPNCWASCQLLDDARQKQGKETQDWQDRQAQLKIIHFLSGENHLKVGVNAIIDFGPREGSTRIGRAGTVRRQAGDRLPS